jgi:putative ABC transport system permease protein
VFVAAALVAALCIATLLLAQGTRASLQRATDRLGADVIVVPSASQAKLDDQLLFGVPTDARLSAGLADDIAAVPGVAAVSPQLYLATLTGAPCCPDASLLMVAYDPSTDFAVRPWLDRTGVPSLGVGDVIGGFNVSVPEGAQGIKIYGYDLKLRGSLDRTGTSLDRTVYLTMDTARAIAEKSRTAAVKPLTVPAGEVSAYLVRVDDGLDPFDAVIAIKDRVKGVDATSSNLLFSGVKRQRSLVTRGLMTVFAGAATLALALVLVAATMAARERRRETGVLRALGATRTGVLRAFTLEAGILSLSGALVGTTAAAGIVYLYRVVIGGSVGAPLELPPAASFAWLAFVDVVVVVLVITLAYAGPPAWSALQDPAQAMRDR